MAEGAHLENSFLFLATGPEDLVALAEQLIHGVLVPDDIDGKRLQEEKGEKSELSPASPPPLPAPSCHRDPAKPGASVPWQAENPAGNADSCLLSSSTPTSPLQRPENSS